MIYLKNNITEFLPPFFIAFLCGVSYRKASADDKRNVLYNYLKSNPKIKPLILEKTFGFSKKKDIDYLRYPEIGLNNLRDIEVLTSLFSNYIFVIHESMATASEIGMFAYNDYTAKKMCILYPDEFAINKDVFGNFFKLAFFNGKHSIIDDKIEFYPYTNTVYHAFNNIESYTYFKNNEINSYLKHKIDLFLKKKDKRIDLTLHNSRSKIDASSYYIENNCAYINLTADFLFYHILALMNTYEVKEILKTYNIGSKKAINEIGIFFKNVLESTLKCNSTEKFSKCFIVISGHKYKTALFYLFYIYHSLGIVQIERDYISRKRNTVYTGIIKYLYNSLIYNKELKKLEDL